MSKYSKAISAVIVGLGAAVANGLIVGRGAAVVATVTAVAIACGVYVAPKNT